MKIYEKPFAEVIDFTAENIMDDSGNVGGDFSVGGGVEDGAPV